MFLNVQNNGKPHSQLCPRRKDLELYGWTDVRKDLALSRTLYTSKLPAGDRVEFPLEELEEECQKVTMEM